MTRHESQRGWFFFALHEAMQEDERIWMLTADLGYGVLDAIRDDFPKRFVNFGASEQLLIGAATGLALEGKIPFCYSITPFLIFRPFEWLRNYLNHENIPVKLVGSGLDCDYEHDGFTHHAKDIGTAMNLLPNISAFYPNAKEEVPAMLREMILNKKPSFIALRR